MKQHKIDQLTKISEPFIPVHLIPLILDKKGNKKIYNTLNNNEVKPTGQVKWNERFQITQDDWKNIYHNVFLLIKERKLQWFQYRVNHRILTTNSFLKIIHKTDIDLCTFCRQQKESIEHLLYECEVVQTFIRNVYSWIATTFSYDVLFAEKEFVLGCAENEINNIINYHLKYYIYCCRCQNNTLMLNSFKSILSNVYNVELKLATKNNYVKKFHDRWRLFEQLKV